MPAAVQSDYGFNRARYHDKSKVQAIAAADSGTVQDVLAARANHTLFIQRIVLSVTVDAAQSLTFQDDAGTPVVIAKSPASPGLGLEVVADFGPNGIGLTQGKNLDVVISGAGLACQMSIEAYEKLTAVTSA